MDTPTRHPSDPVTPAGGPAAAEGPDAFPPASIYGRLLREGYRFDFYQAVRLLERLFPDAPAPGTTSDVRQARIRFRPDDAMVFPAADLKRVAWHEGRRGGPPHVELVATFLGFYGIDAPLPQTFHEPITLERPEAEPLRALLDIFNQRFYAYFYRSWKKYRPGVHDGADSQRADTRRFLSVAGLGTPGATAPDRAVLPQVPALRLAAFAGRLSHRPRNAEGLRVLLETFLGGVPVAVQEFVPRWVTLPYQERLGRRPGPQLGRTALLGRRVRDVAGKFRLTLGPMGLSVYRSLLPGGERAEALQHLIRLYTADRLDFDVELRLHSAEVPRLRLGDGRIQLGLTACLGTPQQSLMPRVVDYDEA